VSLDSPAVFHNSGAHVYLYVDAGLLVFRDDNGYGKVRHGKDKRGRVYWDFTVGATITPTSARIYEPKKVGAVKRHGHSQAEVDVPPERFQKWRGGQPGPIKPDTSRKRRRSAAYVARIRKATVVTPAMAAKALDIYMTIGFLPLTAYDAIQLAKLGLTAGRLLWSAAGRRMARRLAAREATAEAAPSVAARGEAGAVDEAFHHTFERFVESIRRQGLRPGTYATPTKGLSPLQAQIELALPPGRGLPGATLRIDVAGLRAAGYEIPSVTRVSNVVRGTGGRVYSVPGGGYEMQFTYAIPPEFISVVP